MWKHFSHAAQKFMKFWSWSCSVPLHTAQIAPGRISCAGGAAAGAADFFFVVAVGAGLVASASVSVVSSSESWAAAAAAVAVTAAFPLPVEPAPFALAPPPPTLAFLVEADFPAPAPAPAPDPAPAPFALPSSLAQPLPLVEPSSSEAEVEEAVGGDGGVTCFRAFLLDCFPLLLLPPPPPPPPGAPFATAAAAGAGVALGALGVFFFFDVCLLSGLAGAGLARTSTFAAFAGFVFAGDLVPVGEPAAATGRLGVAGDAVVAAAAAAVAETLLLGALTAAPFDLGFLLLPWTLPPPLVSVRGFLSGDLASAAVGAADGDPGVIPLPCFRFLAISSRERAVSYKVQELTDAPCHCLGKHVNDAPKHLGCSSLQNQGRERAQSAGCARCGDERDEELKSKVLLDGRRLEAPDRCSPVSLCPSPRSRSLLV